MNVDEIVKSNSEKTTMDAYNNACSCIRDEIFALTYTANLLSEVGSDKLSNKLHNTIRELEFSISIIEKYVTETHATMYERGNESSNNLFQLGMGMAGIIDSKNKELKNVRTN
jgi:hypothetical protein